MAPARRQAILNTELACPYVQMSCRLPRFWPLSTCLPAFLASIAWSRVFNAPRSSTTSVDVVQHRLLWVPWWFASSFLSVAFFRQYPGLRTSHTDTPPSLAHACDTSPTYALAKVPWPILSISPEYPHAQGSYENLFQNDCVKPKSCLVCTFWVKRQPWKLLLSYKQVGKWLQIFTNYWYFFRNYIFLLKYDKLVTKSFYVTSWFQHLKI